jgi:hypothetical protein
MLLRTWGATAQIKTVLNHGPGRNLDEVSEAYLEKQMIMRWFPRCTNFPKDMDTKSERYWNPNSS